MNVSRKFAVGFIGLTLALGVGVTSAAANQATTAGSKAVSVNTEYLESWDTANDSQWTSAGWKSNWGSAGSLVNKAGFGKIVGDWVVGGGEKLSQIRACRSNTALPMSCSAYVTA